MDKIENNIKGLGLSKYIDQITKKLVLDNSEKKIVVIAQPAFLGAQAGFYQPVPALYHHSSLSEINIKTKKEVLVLFITNNLKNMPPLFVTDTTKRKIGNYGNYNFYTLNVNPD